MNIQVDESKIGHSIKHDVKFAIWRFAKYSAGYNLRISWLNITYATGSIFENGKGKFIRAREEGVFNENVVIIIIGSKFTIKIENVKYQQERAKSELWSLVPGWTDHQHNNVNNYDKN